MIFYVCPKPGSVHLKTETCPGVMVPNIGSSQSSKHINPFTATMPPENDQQNCRV